MCREVPRRRCRVCGCRPLRTTCDVHAIDTNDELLRLNDGLWPSIDRKNEVLLPMVLHGVMAMEEVVLFDSYMPADGISRLRAAGFQASVMVLRSVPSLVSRRLSVPGTG